MPHSFLPLTVKLFYHVRRGIATPRTKNFPGRRPAAAHRSGLKRGRHCGVRPCARTKMVV